MPFSRAERAAIRLAVFVGGAALMALEVAAFRIIGRTFGTAIRETTTVIAVFLTAMSAGYWFGGMIADRWPRLRVLTAVFLASGAAMLAVPFIDRTLSHRIGSSALPLTVHAFFATVILFALPVFFLAGTSPIAMRLLSTDVAETGKVAGGISALSTFGSILGSVATAFVLLDWLQSINRTVVFLAINAFLMAAIMIAIESMRRLASRWSTRAQRVAFSTSLALFAGLALNAILWAKAGPIDLSPYQEARGRFRVVFERDSPYHHIVVRDHDEKWRYLMFDLQRESRMPLGDPAGPGLEYTNFFHIGKALRPSIRRVLFIGLGGGTGPKQFEKQYAEVMIEAADVDPVVVDVAQKFFDVRQSPRLQLHAVDGRVFLQKSTETYDLIVIDAYTSNRYGATIPPHLCTREFFQLAAAHLSENGLLHFHCYAGRLTPLPRALFKTLREVFPTVEVFGETELIASKSPLTIDKTALAAAAPPLRSRILTMADTRPPTLDVPLLTDDYAPVDTLYRRQ